MPQGEITRIVRRSTGPVLIVVDGAEWGSLPRRVVRTLELAEGRTYDLDRLREDADAVMEPCARDRGLLLVSSREHSRAEVVRALLRDGYPEDVVARVADRLEEIGAVDDARFAGALSRSLAVGKGYGRSRIARALREAGIPEGLAEPALEADAPADAEELRVRTRARALAREAGGDVARLAQRLVRRGFAPGLAWAAARETLSDAAEDQDAPDAVWDGDDF